MFSKTITEYGHQEAHAMLGYLLNIRPNLDFLDEQEVAAMATDLPVKPGNRDNKMTAVVVWLTHWRDERVQELARHNMSHEVVTSRNRLGKLCFATLGNTNDRIFFEMGRYASLFSAKEMRIILIGPTRVLDVIERHTGFESESLKDTLLAELSLSCMNHKPWHDIPEGELAAAKDSGWGYCLGAEAHAARWLSSKCFDDVIPDEIPGDVDIPPAEDEYMPPQCRQGYIPVDDNYEDYYEYYDDILF